MKAHSIEKVIAKIFWLLIFLWFSRFLHYQLVGLPVIFQQAVGWLSMVSQMLMAIQLSILNIWWHNPPILLGFLSIGALLLVWIRRRGTSAKRAFAAGGCSALWVQLFISHAILDLNPDVSIWGIALLLVYVVVAKIIPRLPHHSRIRLCALIFLLGAQLGMSLAPSGLRNLNATQVIDELVYEICQTPSGRLFFSMPRCSGLPIAMSPFESHRSCQQGMVAEYDPSTLQPLRQWLPFSENTYGRLEQLKCGDRLLSGSLTDVILEGNPQREAVLHLPLQPEGQIEFQSFDGKAGHAQFYDEARQKIYYVSEFTKDIVLYDLRSKTADLTLAETIGLNHGSWTFHGEPQQQNSLFFNEHYFAKHVWEVDQSSLTVIGKYSHYNGSSWSVTVDPVYERLYVSGFSSLEIFDLNTKALIDRKQLGAGTRSVVIDSLRNQLYVASAIEGALRIYDQESLVEKQKISVGFGLRKVFLLPDHTLLIAANRGLFHLKF